MPRSTRSRADAETAPVVDLTDGDGGRPHERPPSLHDEYVARVRQALIDAALELFAKRGFEQTSTEDILRAARVSRAALYSHFASKQELFVVVLERVESEFIERLVAAGAPGEDIWDEITNGCQSFLDVSLEAPVRRIVLVDGPSVLGWQEWTAIEARYGVGLLRDFLRHAIDAGLITAQPVEPLADLLTGALNQAAMAIAHAADPARARAELGDAVRWLFNSLRASRQPTSLGPA